GLADLSDAEGDFDARGVDDILVVGEDALGGFGTEPSLRRSFLKCANERFQHEAECSRLSERADLIAVRAAQVRVRGRICLKVLEDPNGECLVCSAPVFLRELLGLRLCCGQRRRLVAGLGRQLSKWNGCSRSIQRNMKEVVRPK